MRASIFAIVGGLCSAFLPIVTNAVPATSPYLILRSSELESRAKLANAITSLNIAKQTVEASSSELADTKRSLQERQGSNQFSVSAATISLSRAQIVAENATNEVDLQDTAIKATLMRLNWLASGVEQPKDLAQLQVELAEKEVQHVAALVPLFTAIAKEFDWQFDYLKTQVAGGQLGSNDLSSSQHLTELAHTALDQANKQVELANSQLAQARADQALTQAGSP